MKLQLLEILVGVRGTVCLPSSICFVGWMMLVKNQNAMLLLPLSGFESHMNAVKRSRQRSRIRLLETERERERDGMKRMHTNSCGAIVCSPSVLGTTRAHEFPGCPQHS